MPSWKLKTAVQRLISCMPKSYYWNGLLQKYVTKGYFVSDRVFEGKLKLCGKHLEFYRKFSLNPKKHFEAFELGAGAWPIIPIGLYLCGAERIITYDLHPVLENDTLESVLKHFEKYIESKKIYEILPGAHKDRVKTLKEAISNKKWDTPKDFLNQLNIDARKGDARRTDVDNSSKDLIFSTVVLEHIDRDIILDLYKEFRRIAKPDAIMSHYIGLEDQYCGFDSSITPFNFLRYSDKQWSRYNNPMIPLTRLRLTDHRALVEESGFELLHEESILGDPEDLKSVPLADKFEGYPVEDLLARFSWLVSTPGGFPQT